MPLKQHHIKRIDTLPDSIQQKLNSQGFLNMVESVKRKTGAPMYEIISMLLLGGVPFGEIETVLQKNYSLPKEAQTMVMNTLNELLIPQLIKETQSVLKVSHVQGMVAQSVQTLLAATLGDPQKILKEVTAAFEQCDAYKASAGVLLLSQAEVLDSWLMLPEFASLLAGETSPRAQVRLALGSTLIEKCRVTEEEAGEMVEFVVKRI
ncbi:MAG: hypothetical protein HOA84_00825 [Candidatus Jacksonbacteria bacterium]|nr:hypothetical protein [Candidatus Jacksonbacteria bacterium]